MWKKYDRMIESSAFILFIIFVAASGFYFYKLTRMKKELALYKANPATLQESAAKIRGREHSTKQTKKISRRRTDRLLRRKKYSYKDLFYFYLSFTPPGGTSKMVKKRIYSSSLYENHPEGDPLIIRYEKNKPGIFMVEGDSGAENFLRDEIHKAKFFIAFGSVLSFITLIIYLYMRHLAKKRRET